MLSAIAKFFGLSKPETKQEAPVAPVVQAPVVEAAPAKSTAKKTSTPRKPRAPKK